MFDDDSDRCVCSLTSATFPPGSEDQIATVTATVSRVDCVSTRDEHTIMSTALIKTKRGYMYVTLTGAGFYVGATSQQFCFIKKNLCRGDGEQLPVLMSQRQLSCESLLNWVPELSPDPERVPSAWCDCQTVCLSPTGNVG